MFFETMYLLIILYQSIIGRKKKQGKVGATFQTNIRKVFYTKNKKQWAIIKYFHNDGLTSCLVCPNICMLKELTAATSNTIGVAVAKFRAQ